MATTPKKGQKKNTSLGLPSSEQRLVTIGLVQMGMKADKQSNIAKALRMITHAADQGAQIICLPELFNTLYFPQEEHQENAAHLLAETVPGPTTTQIAQVAKKLGVVAIVPIYEIGTAAKDKGKYYNTAVVINTDGTIAGTYRKMHIPHDPLFWEKNYFEEGNKGFSVVETKYGKIAPLICYDQWFPEAARVATLQGAEILFYPTAIGQVVGYEAPEDWHDGWETIQRGHAIANSVHVAVVNRVGLEDQLNFWGQSFITNAFGKIVQKGSATTEQVVVATVNLSDNKMLREGWLFFPNRRPDAYGLLTKKQ